MNKKNTLRDQMEPILKDIVGDLPDDPSPNSLPDPVGDFLHEAEFGIPRPRQDGAAPSNKALSRDEIAKSLDALSRTLGKPGFASTAQLIKALAAAAETHLAPDDPIRGFLQAYAANDRTSMRANVKKLVEASRAEIVAHLRAGGISATELLLKPDDKLPN